jgi:predicted amidohydrolase YtcJ
LSGKTHAPYERVDVARAMKMVTIDAAYTLGVQDKLGTIETGKLADFTVLEADPQEGRTDEDQGYRRGGHDSRRQGHHDRRHAQS